MKGNFINKVCVAMIMVSYHSYSFLRINAGMTIIDTFISSINCLPYDETIARICRVQKRFPLQLRLSDQLNNRVGLGQPYGIVFEYKKHDDKLIPSAFPDFMIIVRSCLMLVQLVESCCKDWYHLDNTPNIPKCQNEVSYRQINNEIANTCYDCTKAYHCDTLKRDRSIRMGYQPKEMSLINLCTIQNNLFQT